MTVHTCSTARRRTALVSAAAAALLVGTAGPAAAAPDPVTLDRDVACTGFGVRLDFLGEARELRTFTDRDSNRLLVQTGRAEGVVLTRTDEKGNPVGTPVTVPQRGAATRTTVLDERDPEVEGDELLEVVHTGNLLLILFPSDEPAGPTTTLIQGRTVYTVESRTGVFTVRSITGKTTDLCPALEG